jgi:cytochrome c-type biogenesis protein CcmH/NrfF
MPLPPLAHTGHWAVGLIYLAPVAILVITLLVIGRRDRRAEAAELRQQHDQGADR